MGLAMTAWFASKNNTMAMKVNPDLKNLAFNIVIPQLCKCCKFNKKN
jgi:hypothetical protein